jgi:hypothetical protein
MAYTTGGTIQAQDYNWLTWGGNTSGTYTESVNNLAIIWGQGTGQKGYGQDVSAFSTVSATNEVTAAQWSGFVYHLNKSLGHQGQTRLANGSNIGIVAGATVAAFSNVSTAVTQINSTYLSHFAVGTKTTGSNLDETLSSTTGLSIATNYDVTVTFSSTDAARYFFNAGGELQYRCSTYSSGGSGSENSVTRIVDGIGGVNFRTTDNGGRTGSGITLNTNTTSIGYYDLTTSEQTLIKVTDTTASYTASNANLNVYYAGATTRGAKGNVVRFRLNLAVSNKTWNDTISMGLRHRVDIQYPSTTYLANAAGTPTPALA